MCSAISLWFWFGFPSDWWYWASIYVHLTICIFFWRNVYSSSLNIPLFNLVFFFSFLLWSCTCLHSPDTRSNHIWFAHIFHIHRLSFTFLRMFFDAYRILLWWSPVYVFFVACTFGVIPKNSSPNSRLWRFTLPHVLL